MAEAAGTPDAGGITLPHLLRHHAAHTPERIAYTFLHENGVAADVSYRQLATRVAALGAQLARHAAPGERALLLYPLGIAASAALNVVRGESAVPGGTATDTA